MQVCSQDDPLLLALQVIVSHLHDESRTSIVPKLNKLRSDVSLHQNLSKTKVLCRGGHHLKCRSNSAKVTVLHSSKIDHADYPVHPQVSKHMCHKD